MRCSKSAIKAGQLKERADYQDVYKRQGKSRQVNSDTKGTGK